MSRATQMCFDFVDFISDRRYFVEYAVEPVVETLGSGPHKRGEIRPALSRLVEPSDCPAAPVGQLLSHRRRDGERLGNPLDAVAASKSKVEVGGRPVTDSLSKEIRITHLRSGHERSRLR